MLFINLKLYIILSVTLTTVWGKSRLLATERLLEGFPHQITNSTFKRVHNKLYHMGEELLTWPQALAKCRLLGGSLASFSSPNDQQHLSEYLAYYYPRDRYWWLSGSDLHSEGQFAWYGTGKVVEYADWCSGQPDSYNGQEHCLHLRYSNEFRKYQVNDLKCNEILNYVCETKNPEALVFNLL